MASSSHNDFLTMDMYVKAIEGSDSGLWVCDVHNGLCYLSDRYYKMLGYFPREFEGTMANLFSLLHPDDVEKSNQLIAEYFEGKSSIYRNEVRIKCKSGSFLPILTQGLVERDASGNVSKFIGWNIDISSLRDAQRKLDEERIRSISQSRLAQLGLLAGGISHEINNPLTVIQLRTDMITKLIRLDKQESLESILTSLESIKTAAQRISEISKGLRIISDGGEKDNKTEISLPHVVEEVLAVCRLELENRGINLHVQFPQERFYIFANFALLCQVFMNLISNASDALEGMASKDLWIKIHYGPKEALILIEDNGVGVKAEDQDKIMLPFFTTKEPGKGAGLGLSISKSIIESQQGQLSFESEKGLSRFIVKLPLSPQS